MKTVVITGSTRGIGFGLADAFLARGCGVTISGRTIAPLEQAQASLSAKYGSDRLLGQPVDVTDFGQVEALWAAAQARFGRIDIWINNAGTGHFQPEFWTQPPEQMRTVVETNLLGAMFGAAVAIRGMLAQGGGSVYNMEGFGSDGRKMSGMTLYGSAKYGLRYLTEALVEEMRGSPVLVGALSPGMVITGMLTDPYEPNSAEWARAKRVFNILADRVETVTPWLAEQVLANNKHGARLAWLSRPKIMMRFLLAPFRRRDLFEEQEA